MRNTGEMKYRTTSHRNGSELFASDERLANLWQEIHVALTNIDDHSIVSHFESLPDPKPKSISATLNRLIHRELVDFGWLPESAIFADGDFRQSTWRLDFAKDDVGVEVGFNHGEAVAWNLIKPVLAGELNHVRKAVQARVGIVIAATDSLKQAGGFDGAVGSYERYVQYLKPLQQILTVPLVVIGLEAPETFRISHQAVRGKKIGSVIHGRF